MSKKQVIAALLENIEHLKADHARRCAAYQGELSVLNEKQLSAHIELQKVKAENNELLLAAESQFKEYIEDTMADLSQEQNENFRPLFNIKASLEGLRSTEGAGELSDRMRQVLAYVYESSFVEFFQFNKDLLFNIITKVQPGCIIQPIDSK